MNKQVTVNLTMSEIGVLVEVLRRNIRPYGTLTATDYKLMDIVDKIASDIFEEGEEVHPASEVKPEEGL